MVRLLSSCIVPTYSAMTDELSGSFMKKDLILKKKKKIGFYRK